MSMDGIESEMGEICLDFVGVVVWWTGGGSKSFRIFFLASILTKLIKQQIASFFIF